MLVVSNQESSNKWILDSGCLFYMSPIKSWFEELQEKGDGLVLLGNNKACRIKGVGSIRIRMHDGVDRLLKNVRYVPELKRNLIKLGTLDSRGCTFKCENGQMKVLRGSMVVMKAIKTNSLYVLHGETIVGRSEVALESQAKTKLWHLCLGHVNEQVLVELSKQNLLCGDIIQKVRVL